MLAPSAMSGVTIQEAMRYYDTRSEHIEGSLYYYRQLLTWLAAHGARDIRLAVRRAMTNSRLKRTERQPPATSRGWESAPTIEPTLVTQPDNATTRSTPQRTLILIVIMTLGDLLFRYYPSITRKPSQFGIIQLSSTVSLSHR